MTIPLVQCVVQNGPIFVNMLIDMHNKTIYRHRVLFFLYKLYMSRKTRKINKRHKRHTRKRLYRKKRQIIMVPGSQGIPLFTAPAKKQNQLINIHKSMGNLIPGLRNM